LLAALSTARDLMAMDLAAAREAVIVVIFPDGGRNYLSKLYNDEWLRVNGLLGSSTRGATVAQVLKNGHRDAEMPPVVLARTTDRVGAAIDMLQLYGISQMPVSEAPDGDAIEAIIGSVAEKGLLDRTYRDPSIVQRTIGEVMDRPLPTIAADAAVEDAFNLLAGGASALVAVKAGRPAGVVTKLDLLEYLAHHPARD
jgi:cystathionine beta-synthase